MNALENPRPMDLINVLSVSLIQVVLVLSIIGIFVVFGKYHQGVLAAYFYCMYWTFVSQRVFLTEYFGGSAMGMFMFVFLAFSLVVLGVLSLFQNDDSG